MALSIKEVIPGLIARYLAAVVEFFYLCLITLRIFYVGILLLSWTYRLPACDIIIVSFRSSSTYLRRILTENLGTVLGLNYIYYKIMGSINIRTSIWYPAIQSIICLVEYASMHKAEICPLNRTRLR